MGIGAALLHGRFSDRAITAFAVFGISTPTFCCAVLLQYFLAYRLKWFPVSGFFRLEHLVLPSLILGWYRTGSVVRLVRSSMLDAMNADFIRTANMKGLGRTRIVLRHALKNALPPVVNLLAMQSASLFGKDRKQHAFVLFRYPCRRRRATLRRIFKLRRFAL